MSDQEKNQTDDAEGMGRRLGETEEDTEGQKFHRPKVDEEDTEGQKFHRPKVETDDTEGQKFGKKPLLDEDDTEGMGQSKKK